MDEPPFVPLGGPLPQPLPLTLGSDLAGTVEAIGTGVHHVEKGDPVFGVTNPALDIVGQHCPPSGPVRQI